MFLSMLDPGTSAQAGTVSGLVGLSEHSKESPPLSPRLALSCSPLPLLAGLGAGRPGREGRVLPALLSQCRVGGSHLVSPALPLLPAEPGLGGTAGC